MQSRATRRYPSDWQVIWTVAEVIFAIAAPCVWLLVTGMLFGLVGWSHDLQQLSYWWFVALEVVLYSVWLVSGRWHSPRTSALFAGALAAGAVVATTIAVTMLVEMWSDTQRRAAVLAIGVVAFSITAGTAAAFVRATWRAWRHASNDPSFRPWVRAVVIALPLLASCYFFAASARLAVTWSIARVDQGDAEAVAEAAVVLRCTPWADTTPIFWEWETRELTGRDTTAIAELYERVTGWAPESRQESRRYR